MEKYWDMRYGVGTDSNDLASARNWSRWCKIGRDSLQKRSVQRCGGFLSGGTDSSTVVGLMTRAAGAPVKSFSIGFQEQPFNELGYATLAAKKFKSEHHTYLVGPEDCFEALPNVIRCFDGHSVILPPFPPIFAPAWRRKTEFKRCWRAMGAMNYSVEMSAMRPIRSLRCITSSRHFAQGVNRACA